jgi:hypothetical protein
MNFVRSLTLTLLANAGIDISGHVARRHRLRRARRRPRCCSAASRLLLERG